MEGQQDTFGLIGILNRAAPHRLEARPAFIRRALREVGPFPVAGRAWWSDDWHVYRPCPWPHLHQGLDIFAARGTPLLAVGTGRVYRAGWNPVSGLAVQIEVDGTRYFYAHLDGLAKGVGPGDTVHIGQVLGYVGTTGDAVGTHPHVHFEVRPGGVAVPPKPYVDRWLLQADTRAWRLTRSWLRERNGAPLPWPDDRLLDANLIGDGMTALDYANVGLRTIHRADPGPPPDSSAFPLVPLLAAVAVLISLGAGRSRLLAFGPRTEGSDRTQ